MKRVIIFCWFFLIVIHLEAQNKVRHKLDSVHVKGPGYVFIKGTTIRFNKDTIFYVSDTVAMRIRRDREEGSKIFYQNVKEKLSKRRLTKELYDLLFNDVNKPKAPITAAPVVTNEFKKFEGKIINRIIITRLDPFGTRVIDTLKRTNKLALKVGNDIHIKTRKKIVRGSLFFKEGDVIDKDNLSDTERILRSLPYIRDARIYVIHESADHQHVDVQVVTREIWSISGGVDYSNVDNFGIDIKDKNFLGLGQLLQIEFPYSAVTDPSIGYIGTYSVNNIRRTFITGELTYANSQPFERRGIQFYRNFLTAKMKYAGGVELAQEKKEFAKIYLDTTIMYHAKYNFQDFWFGHSILINESEKGQTNFQIAARYYRIRHLERPEVRPDTNQLFFDSDLRLFSFGLTRRKYERSSLVVGYGRTEDIPIGHLIELTIGRENNEFTNRTYLGSILAYGRYFEGIGYIRPSLSVGGFIESKKIEQGVIKPEIGFFSYLRKIRRTSYRQFISLRYVYGFRRFSDEFVSISNNDGIRGLSDTFLRGTKKIAFSSETVIFTPLYLAGFRLAIFGFVDLAIINSKHSKLLDNKLYQGYGIGFRLRNENLAFNTLQIRLGWYPITPEGIEPYNLDFSGQGLLGVPDFRVEEPEVITFQ